MSPLPNLAAHFGRRRGCHEGKIDGQRERSHDLENCNVCSQLDSIRQCGARSGSETSHHWPPAWQVALHSSLTAKWIKEEGLQVSSQIRLL